MLPVCSTAKAAALAEYTRVRKNDQIQDGVLIYERDRRRSLEFTQVWRYAQSMPALAQVTHCLT